MIQGPPVRLLCSVLSHKSYRKVTTQPTATPTAVVSRERYRQSAIHGHRPTFRPITRMLFIWLIEARPQADMAFSHRYECCSRVNIRWPMNVLFTVNKTCSGLSSQTNNYWTAQSMLSYLAYFGADVSAFMPFCPAQFNVTHCLRLYCSLWANKWWWWWWWNAARRRPYEVICTTTLIN